MCHKSEELVEKIKGMGWSYIEYTVRDDHPYNPMLCGWRAVASKEGDYGTIKHFAPYRSQLRDEMFEKVAGREARIGGK